MKKITIYFLTLLLTQSAFADEWIRLADTFYYSKPQAKEYNGSRWLELYTLDNKPDTIGYTLRKGDKTTKETFSYSSMVTKALIYCDEQRYMEMGDRLFDQPMATGNVIRDSLGQQRALFRVELLPGTIAEAILDQVCKGSQRSK